jgi:hypothetical protein
MGSADDKVEVAAIVDSRPRTSTVTQKGNAHQIWKVAVAGFLFLGIDSIFYLGVKSKLILNM